MYHFLGLSVGHRLTPIRTDLRFNQGQSSLQIQLRLLKAFSTKGRRCVVYNKSVYLHQELERQTHSQSNYNTRAWSFASELLRKARLRGKLAKIQSILEKTSKSLIDLNEIKKELERQNQHYAGIMAVPIHKIQGTLGCGKDFSLSFAPLRENTRDR